MPAKTLKKAIHVAVPVHELEPVPVPVPVPQPIMEPVVEPTVKPESESVAIEEAVVEPVQEDTSVVEVPVEHEVVVEPEHEMVEKKSHSFKWLIVLIAFIFGVVVGGAGLRFATYYFDKPTTVASVVVTPTIAPVVAEPTPTVVAMRSDLKVKVLNGSGKPGAAATVKDILTTLGYVVTDTANADKTDYEKTVVTVRTGKKVLGEQLVNDLKKTYAVEDVKETSDLDSGVDALVIVGKK